MIGYCDYDVCCDCSAIDLVTVKKFGWLLLCVWLVMMVHCLVVSVVLLGSYIKVPNLGVAR